jgi:hypothetical protein
MSALLKEGLDVTALHNHFFWEEPRVFYMHVHGMGTADALALKLKPAVALIGAAASSTPAAAGASVPAATASGLNTAALGAPINARMGLNTWAAFVGTDANAAVAGDVAMVASEVTPVLKALRDHGLDVVAIHHHMTDTQPTIFFLHYWGTGPASTLASGVRTAIDQLGKARGQR